MDFYDLLNIFTSSPSFCLRGFMYLYINVEHFFYHIIEMPNIHQSNYPFGCQTCLSAHYQEVDDVPDDCYQTNAMYGIHHSYAEGAHRLHQVRVLPNMTAVTAGRSPRQRRGTRLINTLTSPIKTKAEWDGLVRKYSLCPYLYISVGGIKGIHRQDNIWI